MVHEMEIAKFTGTVPYNTKKTPGKGSRVSVLRNLGGLDTFYTNNYRNELLVVRWYKNFFENKTQSLDRM